jgi:hypothetical protein
MAARLNCVETGSKNQLEPITEVGALSVIIPDANANKSSGELSLARERHQRSCIAEVGGDADPLTQEEITKILTNLKQMKESPKRSGSTEGEVPEGHGPDGNVCCVCFDLEPNAVFMPCGHGGLCYECSVDVWKKSDECYLCRDVITMLSRPNSSRELCGY